MISGFPAFVLNWISVIAISSLIVIGLITISIQINANRFDRFTVDARRNLLWLVALSPWIIGILAGFIALSSSGDYWAAKMNSEIFHWHHPREFILASWHGASIAISMLYVMYVVIEHVLRLLDSGNKLNTLVALAEPLDSDIQRLDTDTPAAFTAGYLKPRSYITQALLSQLSDEEFSIIKLHEKEHVRRYDPAKKCLFQLLTALFPKNVSQRLNQSMSTAMEQGADRAISDEISDRATIATTLLKVRRLVAQPLHLHADTSLICNYGIDNIEQRIEYLLADDRGKSIPIVATFLFFTGMSVLCAMSADFIHHTIEYTLSHY
jgi:hypothetical protein